MKTLWTIEPDWPYRAEALAKAGDRFEIRGFQYAQHVGTYAYLAVKYRMRARYDRLHQIAVFEPAHADHEEDSELVGTGGSTNLEIPMFG